MLIKNATLPDGRSGIDVLVREGRIAALGLNLAAPEGVQVIEAAGQLLSLPSSTPTSHGRDADAGSLRA